MPIWNKDDDPVSDAIVWDGAESLRGGLVPLATLQPHEQNPRRGNVQKIGESLTRFGQVRPIIVTEDDTIIAGNHTFKAAQELGWTHIAVVAVTMNEADALSYLIADNRTSDLSSYEDDLLADSLKALAADGLLTGTGWTDDEATEFLAALAVGGDTDSLLRPPDVAPEPPEDPDPPGEQGGNPDNLKAFTVMLQPDLFPTFVAMVDFLQQPYGVFQRDLVIYEALKRSAELEGYDGT